MPTPSPSNAATAVADRIASSGVSGGNGIVTHDHEPSQYGIRISPILIKCAET